MKQILTNATGTGAAKIFKCESAVDVHTLQIVTQNAMSALTVDLEGSIDGVYFYQIGQKAFSGGELSAKNAILWVTGKFVEFVRVNITTYTGSGNVNAYYTPATADMRQVD